MINTTDSILEQFVSDLKAVCSMKFFRWTFGQYAGQVRNANPLPVELFLALVSISFGVWILNPFQDSFVTPTYAIVGSIVPEPIAGMAFLANGILRLYSLYRFRWRWRIFFSMSGYTLWFSLLIGVVAANPAATLIPLYLILMLISAHVALRVRYVYKIAARKAQND